MYVVAEVCKTNQFTGILVNSYSMFTIIGSKVMCVFNFAKKTPGKTPNATRVILRFTPFTILLCIWLFETNQILISLELIIINTNYFYT